MNERIVVGGLYYQSTPPPFFRGVLPGISRSLKAEMHDAAVLLAVRKEPLDEQRKETR